jgi:hypothetical protein
MSQITASPAFILTPIEVVKLSWNVRHQKNPRKREKVERNDQQQEIFWNA